MKWPKFEVPKSIKWKFAGKQRQRGYTKEVWCVCVCGTKRWIPIQNLKLRKSKQCTPCSLLTHGGSHSRIYTVWKMLKQRCLNPKSTGYKHYGGRGIKVCKQWLDFSAFRKWALVNGYRDDLTIERKNVNGNYTPRNCTWIPNSEQSNNTRRTHRIDGKNLSQWAVETGLNRGTIQGRLNRGHSGEGLWRPIRKQSSKFPGVSFDCSAIHKPWKARFGNNGKVYRLGRFATEREAHEAYKKAKGK